MTNPRKAIIVKDDGHIDPNIWFGRYGIKYKILKRFEQKRSENPSENPPSENKKKNMLIIKTSSEGIRRWHLGIHESKKKGTQGWQTLELRLYVMKHGVIDGFQFKNFDDYQRIIEFYA